MKKLALTILSSLLASGMLIVLSGSLKAQERIPLTVAPARQYVNVNPGGTVSLVTKFFNEGDTSIAGEFRVYDFIVTDKEGSPTFLYQGNLANRFSAASWMKLTKDKAMIGAGAVERVQYTITAPKDAAPGGRYVALIFEPVGSITQESVEKSNKAALSVLPRIASLLYIRVNGPVSEMAFVKRLFTPSFLEYGPVTVTAEISNKGDLHITPQGEVSLFNMIGRKVDTKVLEKQNIFPDSTRAFDFELGSKVLLGKYKVRLAAAYGETGKAFTQETTFWAFPVRLVIIVTLAIVIAILLAMFIWKKVKGKQSRLEEKLEEEISEIEGLKKKFQDKLPQVGNNASTTTPSKLPENKIK
jgi:hypothetical protein